MTSSEVEIRQIIESRVNAVRKGNVEAMSADQQTPVPTPSARLGQ